MVSDTSGGGFGDSASRIGQPALPAIRFEGRRYEQVMNGEGMELPQRTGYLAVFDDATDEVVQMVRVYDVPFDPEMEADVQDVFFTAMDLDASARRIEITNELEHRFSVDIDTLKVSAAD